MLAVPEFRALWSAEVLSVAGDQLARVGLAVLVFSQTDSAGLTALTYALTFLPALLGGVLLGGLADRFPRRELMVTVDLARAGCAGLMAVPTLPLPVLMALVFLLTLGGAPFKAAQQALLPTILSGPRFVAGLALRTVTNQSAQVAGFLGGGALVAMMEPQLALGLNAVTFLVAALVLTTGVAHRPAARGNGTERSVGAARLIWHDPRLRALTALSWLAGLFIVPEALAAPYARDLGAPVAAVGLLMAAIPIGSIAGGWLVARVREHRRDQAIGPFALAAGVPLALCLFGPPLPLVTALWAVSGVFATAYLVLAQAAFVLAVPDRHRGAASGLAGAGVLSSQGVAVLGAGILADMTSPVLAVTVGGVAGIALSALIGAPWLRARTRVDDPDGRETDGADHGADHDADVTVTSPSYATSRTPPLHEQTPNPRTDPTEVTSPNSATRTPPQPATTSEPRTLTSPNSAPDTPPSPATTTGQPALTSPSYASSAPPSTSTNSDEPALTSPNSAPRTPPHARKDTDNHGLTSPSYAPRTPPSPATTSDEPPLTNPSYATSRTPPFRGITARLRPRTALTSPNSPPRTPPLPTPVAHARDDNQQSEVTSPSYAPRTPPSPARTTEKPPLTNPSSPPRTPPTAEYGNGQMSQHTEVTSPNSPPRTPPPTELSAGLPPGGTDQSQAPRSRTPASLSTDQRSRLPTRWSMWREPARVIVLLLFVEAAAVGLTVFQALRASIDVADLTTLAVIVCLGLAMGEMTRHVERVRRRFNDTPHVNLTSVWTFSAILMLPAVLVPMVTCALYLHLFWRSWYRVRSVRAYRLVFTASTVVLAAYSASAIRDLTTPADKALWGNPAVVAAVALAIVAYSLVNLGLVATAITLHERKFMLRRALGTGKEAALEYGTICLGAITALLIDIHPAWALLIIPVLLVLHRSVLMRQLEEAASTDQKTGLANATAWTNMASAEVRRAERDDTQVGVLMVDLDHFKSVNDTHGHLVGDRVLQAVADTLTGCARRYDVVGRWGGEEFVVLCPEVTPDTLRGIGERICERVRELRVPVAEPGGEVVCGLTVSIGLAVYPKFGPDLQDVLLAADDALFVAKDSGRDQVQMIVAAVGDLNGYRG
ncbi:hypothetical protein BLA60_36625 [Actinophytocola xinjiangensis]|uniref:GGDEF domain-containing protein n=1 Tax=Actinophytocola xinjiangensis TaxID=485602 RepID=A0A7Z0WEG6_9PSEU|nr:MFS transporter [Actinophytocola xinjiangensis]OLF05352.1 hypothetical protein BLA60_36625 [Actinophytocola xinjiangensis]